MSALEKLSYWLKSAEKRLRGQGGACPSCGSLASSVIARKYLITELRRCETCRLLFRSPTTSQHENSEFYQERYSQGFTTSVPSQHEVDQLISREFRGTEKDYSAYIAVLRAAGVEPGARLLDFGCSWGYGSWQLQRAGFEVTSFEISRPRCRFAKEKLGVRAHSDLSEIAGPFDAVFSAHVLEHVPAVSDVVSLARGLLRPGGLFVAFTPNGSQALRTRRPDAWMTLWGHVHPNFLDADFYRQAFARDRRLLGSSPYDLARIGAWSAGTQDQELALDGDELLVAAQLGSQAAADGPAAMH